MKEGPQLGRARETTSQVLCQKAHHSTAQIGSPEILPAPLQSCCVVSSWPSRDGAGACCMAVVTG